ncbi:NifU family protein [Flavonifractor sp. AGMB03687]|uniref:NifU family protein n=1 Tax=Flavonifractor sp. AGMB03687 TaxID=2785133 RepID=UPI0032AE8F5A
MSDNSKILERIEGVLEEKVRPDLALHGGNIRSLNCEDGVYRFQLTGQCAGCPSAMLTTENLIKSALLESIPELKDVVLVGGVSQDLLDQARAILRGERPCGSE